MQKYLPFYKRNLQLALPIIFSQLGQVLVQQVDTMMVGYVGTVELAASAFANSVFIIGMIMVMGFTFGLTPLVGQAQSKKDKKYLRDILTNSHLINIVFSFIIIIGLLTSSFFFTDMGQDIGVATLSKPYFYTLIASILPLILFLTHKQFAEGIGDTKTAMYVMISSNIVNIILNYLLIFGKFGFPGLGLLGAGIATLISRIYMAVIIVIIFKNKERFSIFVESFSLRSINKVHIKKLFQLGIPISMQMLLEVSAFGLTAIMAGWLGVIPLAAHQIAMGMASISFMIVVGIGSATTIRVAHQYGRNDLRGLMMASKASIHLVLSIMAIAAIGFILFRNQIPKLYTQDASVIEISAMLLIIVAIFQLFDGLQVIMLGILRGLGDVNHAMIYAFFAYIVINLPLGYYLGFVLGMGITGLWIAFLVGLGCAAFLFAWRFRHLYSIIKSKTI